MITVFVTVFDIAHLLKRILTCINIDVNKMKMIRDIIRQFRIRIINIRNIRQIRTQEAIIYYRIQCCFYE